MRRSGFTFFVAIRYLFARVRSTLLILLGVGIGVFVMTFMQSMMFGFQGQALDTLLSVTPGILVKGRPRGAVDEGRLFTGPGALYAMSRLKPIQKEKGIRGYRLLEERVRSLPGIVAVAPIVQGGAILRYGTSDRGVTLFGVSATDYDRVVEFRSKLVGRVEDLVARRDGVIVGFLLAEELGARIGSRVQLVGAEGRTLDMRVVGLFKSGLTVLDRTTSFVNLSAGQLLLDRPGSVTGMAIKVSDPQEAPQRARQVEWVTGLESQSWQEVNANIYAIIRQQNATTFGTVGLTVLVAGFGIANSLITAVLEKRRDIGILRALGVTASGITAVFVAEGVLIGLAGTGIGLLLASWAIDVMARTPLPGRGGLSTATTFVMLRTPWVYVASASCALLVSLVASLFPAMRAAKYDPVEIIRTAK